MVGGAEQRILHIDDVAAQVDRNDLAAAVAGQLVANGESGNQQAGVLGLVPVPHEELAGLDLPQGERQREDRFAVVVGELFAHA